MNKVTDAKAMRDSAFETAVRAAGKTLEAQLAAAGDDRETRRAAWERYGDVQDKAGAAYRAAQAAEAVRARPCPLCGTPAGQPCQDRPEADHLARWLDSYTAGYLTRQYMARVLGELVVIDACAVIAIPESARTVVRDTVLACWHNAPCHAVEYSDGTVGHVTPPCKCGHAGEAHPIVIAGGRPATECAECGCGRFDGYGEPDVIPEPAAALLAAGHTLTYSLDVPGLGWFADLRDADGRLVENGNGANKSAALAHLADRLGRAR